MITVKTRFIDETPRVKRAVADAVIRSWSGAGAYIRGIAQKSIKTSPWPASPGKPPHTRRGKLRRAIAFGVEKGKRGVVIGPVYSTIIDIGGVHEHSAVLPGKFKNQKIRVYPKRPFMLPALEISKSRLPTFWRGSVRAQ